MDESLAKKIKILMSNVLVDNNEGSYTLTNQDRVVWDGEVVINVVEEHPEDWELGNKQAKLLVKLYQQLTASEQKAMLKLLYEYFEDNYKYELVQTAVLVFVHTDNIKSLFYRVVRNFNKYTQSGYMYVIAALNDAVEHQPNLFPEDIIEGLYDWVNDYFDGKNKLGTDRREWPNLYANISLVATKLRDKCNVIISRNFAVQIESAFNPELNVDEKKVIEAIELIGFPLDLVESLKHIDELVQNANTPMKYRDTMSAIRVFTERLYEKIAKELHKGTKVDGKDSSKAAKLFREKKLISEDVASLMVSMRHFLSNDGVHRLKSRKEDSRIAKNITIELSLYLLTRLRELKDPQAAETPKT